MITPLTPLDWKRRAVKLYPDKTAVIDGDQRWTYRQFDERTWRLSNALWQTGIRPGDHVAVMLPNTHHLLECFYGITQIGAVIVPINIRLSSEDVEYIINHSDAKMLISDSEYGNLITSIQYKLSQITKYIQVASGYDSPLRGEDYEQFIENAFKEPILVDIDENQELSINYTSGTTSRPKGVILTHRCSYINGANCLYHLQITHDDVYLHTLPLFHVNGWGVHWAVTAVGGTHVCLRKVDPVKVLELFVQENVSLACGAPTVINMLVHAPGAEDVTLTTKTRIATAGSPPPAAIIEKAQQLFNMNIIHVYGLTEVSPFITYCEWRSDFDSLSPEEQARMKARQGVELLFNGETAVIREDGTEVEWNGKEIGEIVARGNVVMKGYYKQPEETAKAIRDGWFHTGDLAVIHPGGYIEIVDRLKDVIISGGENVSSVEVEGVIYKHPAVLDCGVVAAPDEKWGEVPKAFVVVKPGMQLTAEELNTWCREYLAHFKTPKQYEFVDSLPRTSTGKLQKFRLREQVWQDNEKKVH